MLEIAIWGIALMLVVKGLDVLHRQFSTRSEGHSGAPGLAYGTAAVSMTGAILLIVLARGQGELMFRSPEVPRHVTSEEVNESLAKSRATLDELERLDAIEQDARTDVGNNQ